jgi:hypothetical protein
MQSIASRSRSSGLKMSLRSTFQVIIRVREGKTWPARERKGILLLISRLHLSVGDLKLGIDADEM